MKKRGRLPASASAPSRTTPWTSLDQRNHGHGRTNGQSGGFQKPSSPAASPQSSTGGHDIPAYRSYPHSSFMSLAPEKGQTPPGAAQTMSQNGHRHRHSDTLSTHGTDYSPHDVKRLPSLTQDGLQPHRNGPNPGRPHSRPPVGSPHAAATDVNVAVDSDAPVSDASADHLSPGNRGGTGMSQVVDGIKEPSRLGTGHEQPRQPFGATPTPEGYVQDGSQKAPTDDCHYKFLYPVLPYIRNIIPASVACDLLDIFLTDPGSSLFRGSSPYILTRIFRRRSITHPTHPRVTTPALLATILWCVAQTADVMLLHVPGSRAKIVNELYDVATSLVSERDPDGWRRIHGRCSSVTQLISVLTAMSRWLALRERDSASSIGDPHIYASDDGSK